MKTIHIKLVIVLVTVVLLVLTGLVLIDIPSLTRVVIMTFIARAFGVVLLMIAVAGACIFVEFVRIEYKKYKYETKKKTKKVFPDVTVTESLTIEEIIAKYGDHLSKHDLRNFYEHYGEQSHEEIQRLKDLAKDME